MIEGGSVRGPVPPIKRAPDTGGTPGGGAPQPPDANATIRQIADQSASQALTRHEQGKPHLGEGDVRRIANEQHDAATHTGLASQADVDALSGRVDHVAETVEELERRTGATPPNVTPQAVADAVRQDPNPFVVAIRPHLPAGGAGLSETEIRTLAADEVNKATAAQRPDGWVNPTEVEQIVQDKIDDETLASGQAVEALGTRITAVEGRMPAGTDPLITATDAAAQIQTARDALEAQVTQVRADIPANIVTADVLNRRLPPPTAGQRILAMLGDRRARQYVNDYDANAPAAVVVAPATPAVTPAPTVPVVERRNVLIGTGAVLVGAGVCAWLGLPAVADFLRRISGTEYTPPSGGQTTGGGNLPAPEYTPTGLDYSSMTPQQAEQIIKYVDATYSHSDGPTVSVDIPDGQVGIVTGWQVSYNGTTYVKGDTAAFTGHANVSFSDGRWRVVPANVAKDAFVALVVYTKALNEDMSHAQPLSSWGLPAFG